MCHIDKDLLNRLMSEKGINTKTLSLIAQVDNKTIYNVLNGHTRPCFDVLIRVIFALEMTMEQFEALTILPNQDVMEQIRDNSEKFRD